MDYSHYQALKIEIDDGIAVVTLNRPEQLNTFGGSMHGEVENIFVDMAQDDAVNTIILTGAGKAFSAGGDIKAAAQRFGTDEGWKHITGVYYRAKRLVENILNCPKPTIAAVNGDAMGLGTSVALCCDMQVVSETARFADTHVKVGLVAGDGGSVIWPLLIGPNRAKEMLMCAKMIYGKEAAAMGLVNHSVPADQVMAKSMEIAKVLRSMPPMAVKWTKVSINKMIKDQFNLVMDAAIAYEMCSMVTQDRGEAIHAFLEKRKPEYKGY